MCSPSVDICSEKKNFLWASSNSFQRIIPLFILLALPPPRYACLCSRKSRSSVIYCCNQSPVLLHMAADWRKNKCTRRHRSDGSNVAEQQTPLRRRFWCLEQKEVKKKWNLLYGSSSLLVPLTFPFLSMRRKNFRKENSFLLRTSPCRWL